MGIFDEYFSASFWLGVQNVAIALVVLLVGWLVAKIISNGIRKALEKTQLDEKLLNKFAPGEKQVDTNKVVAKFVYYVLLLIVVIIFFNVLNLSFIANPLSDLISTILGFIPVVLKAALILLLAWICAFAARWIIVQIGRKAGIHRMFSRLNVTTTEEEASRYIQTAGSIAYYFILLLFIPGILDALNIQGVAQPFSGLVASILLFVPKLLAASLTLLIGWFLAKIVRTIVTNLLKSVGSEKLIERLKLQSIFAKTSFASFVGTLVFVLILIPITIAALEQLHLTGITEPAISMLNQIMEMLPNIVIAIALILAGVWLGKLIGTFVQGLLAGIGFDRLSANIEVGNWKPSGGKMTPSMLVGYIVQVLIVFFLTVQALYLIKLDFLVGIATAITAYLPNVLVAALIVGVALIAANIVEKVLGSLLVGAGFRIIVAFAKYAIIVLAVFMALTQLGIAATIVSSAFTIILGGLALAFGLAFGLGGKEFAAKYLRKFDQTLEETKIQRAAGSDSNE